MAAGRGGGWLLAVGAVAIAASAVLAALGALQLALAAGAPLGRLAWGGQHEVLPTALRIASAVSIGAYAWCCAVVTDAAGLVDACDGDWPRTAVAVLAGYFGLGVVVNAVSRSRPERLVMTPVAAVLAALFLVAALRA